MVKRDCFGFLALCALNAIAACACPTTDYASAWAKVEDQKDEVFGSGQGGSGGDSASATPECTSESVAKDCEGPPSPQCGSAICIDGKCALEIKEGPIASQKYGDCKITRCTKHGELESIDDDTDFYNDGNQCTIDFCLDGAAHFELSDGTQCPEAGDGYCYQGKCVECIAILLQATCNNPQEQCDGTICEPFTAQCSSACGGVCAPCKSGFPCVTAADCVSGICANGVCQSPTCNDGVKNDGETGLDCGAPSCSPCPANQGCSAHSDCESKVCMAGICQAPTCIDGETNGDETDIDCGGAKCAPCLESP